ncbi:MAG TPA: hypothetical protein VHL78_11560 [Actinomycetota bacterium]|nr:hypothetical protein [Actinomycetota bacterium]
MAEERSSEAWAVRLGAVSGIAGALLGMVGNLLHPQGPTGNAEGVARTIAESDLWIPVHLAIVVGLILMLGGLAAIHHAIQHGLAGALARLGYATAIAGTTVGVVLVILDGLASKRIAEAWVTAPANEAAAALRLVLAEQTINFALAALFNILFAAVTFMLFGLAVAASRSYPRWLGWVAAVAGAGSFGVGILQAVTGESTGITQIATIVFPTVITLWIIVMGVLLLRRREPATAVI